MALTIQAPSNTIGQLEVGGSPQQGLRSKSVTGALMVGVGGAGEFVLRLGSAFILARLLTPEHFGLFGMVAAFSAIATQLSQMGLSTATIQRQDLNYRQVTNLFWVNAGLGALASLAFCLLGPFVAAFYKDQRLIPISLALSTGFLWAGLGVQHEALLFRNMMQAKWAGVRLTGTLVSVCLAIFLAYAGYGYWALVWQEITRSLCIMIGVWLAYPWRPGLPVRGENIRSLLSFGTDLTIAQVFYALCSNVDRLVVGKLFGAGPLGMYRQAQQLIMVPLEQITSPIGSVSQAGLSRLQNNADLYKRYYQKATLMIAFSTMPVAAFGALYADDLVTVLLGKAWTETGPYFRAFALAGFIRPILGTTGTVLISSGRPRRLMMLTFLAQGMLIAFMLIGLRWGALGVAASSAVTALALLLPTLYFSFQGTSVSIANFFRAVRTPAVASALMVGVLFLLRMVMPDQTSLMALIGGTVLGALLYLVFYVLLPGGREELGEVISDLGSSLPGGPALQSKRVAAWLIGIGSK
jgi:O-antigen/teichoic acid export membrane protein